MPLSLSFEEAIKWLTTNITVNRSEQCSRCNGAGDIGGPVVVCSTCKGSGQVQRVGGRLLLRRSVRIVVEPDDGARRVRFVMVRARRRKNDGEGSHSGGR